jgi:two-component system sensor histidine kinase KdpD
VGKTSAMLAEGRRRADNGERVAVGWIEWHGRPAASRQLGGLQMVAPRLVAYRGAAFADFDAPAAIASGADVVLVDELAHATADRTRQRWQDVAEVLHVGLDVLTTINVAHLRSVRDFAARITGAGTVAWVPDEFVRSGEVVLVDLPAAALRQRIASGAVYSAGGRWPAISGPRTCGRSASSGGPGWREPPRRSVLTCWLAAAWLSRQCRRWWSPGIPALPGASG